MKIEARYQINVGIPVGMGEALDRVTRERGWTPTRYAREAVLERLAKDLKRIAPDRRETAEQQS